MDCNAVGYTESPAYFSQILKADLDDLDFPQVSFDTTCRRFAAVFKFLDKEPAGHPVFTSEARLKGP